MVAKTGSGLDLNDIFGLHFFLARDFHVWQLVTYMFMHANIAQSPAHLFFNMFALWMFGCVLERVWGERKFLIYYLTCGIGAGVIQEVVQYVSFGMAGLAAYDTVVVNGMSMPTADYLNLWTTVGASGAIFAILLAFGMTFPEQRIFIFPLPIPIKAKWFVCLYAAAELFSALATPGDHVAHFAHLGGMLVGFFIIRYWRRHPDSYYDQNSMGKMFDDMRQRWEQRQKAANQEQQRTATRETDWEYNARKKAEQDEIDSILDKIRKSGYDSLTRVEKQKLFDRNTQN